MATLLCNTRFSPLPVHLITAAYTALIRWSACSVYEQICRVGQAAASASFVQRQKVVLTSEIRAVLEAGYVVSSK